jgi:hypothetical protein
MGECRRGVKKGRLEDQDTLRELGKDILGYRGKVALGYRFPLDTGYA